MLQNAWERWKDARAMVEKAKQRINVVNEVKADADRKRKAVDSSCEAKKSRLDRDRESAKRLMSAIRGCNVDRIFDVESILELPFPSLSAPTNRFQLKNHTFDFQARSDLKPLYDKIVRLWKEGRPITVNVAGTTGYGKSHMLAVLVLLLLKTPIEYKDYAPPFVCYIPDCRELLCTEVDVVKILQQNILVNMPDYTGQLLTIQDIRAFMKHRSVILVVDQWNSMDENNPDCRMARERLGSCLSLSVCVEIHGMSMIACSWLARLHKPTSEDNNIYYGGLKDDEFVVWLKHHPTIFTENEDEVALLTGKVPLLLSVFARVYQDGDSWESVVQRVQQDAIVENLMSLLDNFYANMDEDLVWKVCKLSNRWLFDMNIVDFRFFYEDRVRGLCATSQIVLRLVYRVWKMKSATDALLTRWRGLLSLASTPSSIGFAVVEIIKANVCQQGVVGKYALPDEWTIKRESFKPSTERETLTAVIEGRANMSWILLDPEIFNYPGVDMILVTDTTLVGINVTVAKTNPPLGPFFNLWGPLAESHEMQIKGLFVARDDFVHKEDNVETAFLRDVNPELWRVI
ncbi:hypothetical protein AC1031_016174 [Aphanomyces cochlioides]|nr:hypothetical protein AC1031_016174 [Aphanomyces cochlioides]